MAQHLPIPYINSSIFFQLSLAYSDASHNVNAMQIVVNKAYLENNNEGKKQYMLRFEYLNCSWLNPKI